MFDNIKKDLQAAVDRDPAANSKWIVWFTYPGFKAIKLYRMAHWLTGKGFKFLPAYLSYKARKKYSIDIHPAAKIGEGIFIDHGTGVVIGETAEIGNNVTIYQGVTLGGTGKETGKRHPTIGNNVMISAGAKILGPVTIGDDVKIGAGSVVLRDVPSHATVVGVPGRVVRMFGKKIDYMDQTHFPDPMMEEVKRLNERIIALEEKIGIKSCHYSISINEDNLIEENPKNED